MLLTKSSFYPLMKNAIKSTESWLSSRLNTIDHHR